MGTWVKSEIIGTFSIRGRGGLVHQIDELAGYIMVGDFVYQNNSYWKIYGIDTFVNRNITASTRVAGGIMLKSTTYPNIEQQLHYFGEQLNTAIRNGEKTVEEAINLVILQ